MLDWDVSMYQEWKDNKEVQLTGMQNMDTKAPNGVIRKENAIITEATFLNGTKYGLSRSIHSKNLVNVTLFDQTGNDVAYFEFDSKFEIGT